VDEVRGSYIEKQEKTKVQGRINHHVEGVTFWPSP